MRKFTAQEDQYIRDKYLTTSSNRIGKQLGRSGISVRRRMKLLGLVVPPEIIEQFKKAAQIKPGTPPFNKGRPRSEWMSEDKIERVRKAQFKKGQLPHNTKHDHAVTIRRDKRGTHYRFIRVAKAQWVPLLRYNWEQLHGPIPKGYNLVHKDGNSLNDDASNGLLMSNADLMNKNSYHQFGPEISRLIQIRGALTRQINKATKKIKS